MKPVRVGIVGFGTVGQATAQLVATNADLIQAKSGVRLAVSAICRRSAVDSLAIPAGARVTSQWDEVVLAPDVDVVVETMGGVDVARQVVNQALESGKPVVTANKSLIAAHGDAIFALATSKRLPVGIEATTAGGIPIVRTLRQAATGDRVSKVYGILNGTCNYILTRMETENLEFDNALVEAQCAGYAEANPSFDIDGIDSCEKLCILARLAFHARVQPESISVTGIRHVTQVDLQYAQRLHGRIRLVGAAERQGDGVTVAVRPWLVPKDSMLGKVEGVFNAVFIEGEHSGMQMFYGRGAGGAATSTAVVADLIDIAQQISGGTLGPVAVPGFDSAPELAFAERGPACGWYLRLTVSDRPGIIASVATVLAEEQINIDSVLQEPHLPKERLSFVITVEPVTECAIRHAVERLSGFDFLVEPILLVRISE